MVKQVQIQILRLSFFLSCQIKNNKNKINSIIDMEANNHMRGINIQRNICIFKKYK